MPSRSAASLARALVLGAALASFAAPANAGQAQPPPGQDCKAPEHRQFDFWLGSWDVTAQGKPAGSNRIVSDMSGCVLVENWTAAGGGRGTSLNFYDRQTRAWYQTWIDERGGALHLKGGLQNGRMVLESGPVPRGNGTVLQRITWSRETDGVVRQLWESSTDGGKVWTTAFDGRYVKQRVS